MEDGEILHNCKSFRWYRVKMVKKFPKNAEIILGVLHTINDNIFTFFCFSTFSFAYILDPVFRVICFKFCQNSGFVKCQNKKIFLSSFLAIFTLFRLKHLQLCKISPSSISKTL